MYERAVGAAAEELDGVEAADDVGVEREEVLDVPAVARQVAQLLLVEAAGDRRASMVMLFCASAVTVTTSSSAADVEVDVGKGHRRRPQQDAGRTRP